MVTSGVIYHILRFLTFPVDIRNICVLLAPGFSGLTAFATYLFTSEMSTSPSAGLLAAIFMGITPGYISRSVAGSYDNEAIAIFLLVFTFFLWIKAVRVGSIMWGALTALFYGYMVSAWEDIVLGCMSATPRGTHWEPWQVCRFHSSVSYQFGAATTCPL